MDRLLARPGLDLGIPTDHGAAMRAFYEHELGLTLHSENEIIEGHDEVFYELHGSWLKLNTSVEPLAPAVTGFRALLVADPDPAADVRTLHDPDGLPVTVMPRGHLGLDELGLEMLVPDIDAQARFLLDGCGAERVGERGYRVGNTVIFLERSVSPMAITPIVRRGLTMLTFVVTDLLDAHQFLLDHGAIHGLRAADDPGVPGRCLFSFVRDPNGNWIELVQFAEDEPLDPPPWPNPRFEEFIAFRDHGTPA
jgi:catechol 2,3-dioxygenase-like lactoylglutathione lyase family enzyme